MLKKITIFLLAVICVLSLSSCGECVHEEWEEATCTQAKRCVSCQTAEGEPLGHSWTEATYEAPKTCSACGETEGEPLEKPKYSEEEILASNTIAENQFRFDFLYGSAKELRYDEENGILHFVLTPPSGAADAYAARGDNWGLYTAYIRFVNADVSMGLKKEGYDVSFRMAVLDDRDTSKALYEIQDQGVLTDAYADIVPEPLKTFTFRKAFDSVYHSYAENHEVTAEYSAGEGNILYFFIRLDSNTSFHLNSLSNAEVYENNFWKSITESVTKWSAQYTEEFAAEGHDVLCVYMLIDGNTVEDVFYAVANGTAIYNAFE